MDEPTLSRRAVVAVAAVVVLAAAAASTQASADADASARDGADTPSAFADLVAGSAFALGH